MIKQTKVKKAATGWTTRMADREFRALEGRLKSPLSLSFVPKMFSITLALSTLSHTIRHRHTRVVSHSSCNTLRSPAISEDSEIDILISR